MIHTTATFKDGRIGRDRGVGPLEVAERDPEAVARAILRHALKHLASRGVELDGDIEKDGTGRGVVLVGGFRTVAEFTLAPTPRKEDT